MGMSLVELDNMNLETLFDYLFYKPKNPNKKIIGGKVYKRAEGVPNWL